MKNNFKYSASVEQYLSNEMVQSEKQLFERETASNPGLAQELKFSRTIDDALRQDDIIDLRMKLLSAYRENRKEKAEVPVVRMQFRKVWYAAASIIILAAIGSTILFRSMGTDSNERLFKQYYSPENLINVTRSGDANIVEAVMQFQEKNYPVAAKLFKQILSSDKDNFAGWFFYGISCIETENYVDAEKAFNTIIVDDQNLYTEHAEWYLGLCFLKSNQTVKAREQLTKISTNPENIHRMDARHLLEKLN
ncbi:MAG: tetratricopeptide repeat protein [Bacteroidales bacterium]|nr:tetratricopeptide repeat protein [Bacteroidales bacterium]